MKLGDVYTATTYCPQLAIRPQRDGVDDISPHASHLPIAPITFGVNPTRDVIAHAPEAATETCSNSARSCTTFTRSQKDAYAGRSHEPRPHE